MFNDGDNTQPITETICSPKPIDIKVFACILTLSVASTMANIMEIVEATVLICAATPTFTLKVEDISINNKPVKIPGVIELN